MKKLMADKGLPLLAKHEMEKEYCMDQCYMHRKKHTDNISEKRSRRLHQINCESEAAEIKQSKAKQKARRGKIS